MIWPDQYGSAKFAALRQFERERESLVELREAARPDTHTGRVPSLTSSKSNEWEMKGARVGAAAGLRSRRILASTPRHQPKARQTRTKQQPRGRQRDYRKLQIVNCSRAAKANHDFIEACHPK